LISVQSNPIQTKGIFRALPFIFVWLTIFTVQANAQESPHFSEWGRSDRMSNPGSTLGEPFVAPIYLAAHLAFGGAFQYDQGNTGYGLEFIIRPGSAVKFLDFLYRKNIGVVLQADYMNVDANRRILSGDFILRKYFSNMRYPKGKKSPFVGFGFGGSEILLAPPEGNGIDKYWSWVVEAGQEWTWADKYVVYAKGQYRHYGYHGYDYSNWSVIVGAGITAPW
jgi:hypothetical protein